MLGYWYQQKELSVFSHWQVKVMSLFSSVSVKTVLLKNKSKKNESI